MRDYFGVESSNIIRNVQINRLGTEDSFGTIGMLIFVPKITIKKRKKNWRSPSKCRTEVYARNIIITKKSLPTLENNE